MRSEPSIDSTEMPSFLSGNPPSSRLEQQTLITAQSTQIDITPPAPVLRNRPVLVRMDEAHAGQVCASSGPELRLGRHPDNHVILDDDGISRYHARFYQSGGRCIMEDLGSSNGTYVNGTRIRSCELSDGCTVQLGPRVCFRFSIVDEQQERVLRQLYESSVRDPLTGAYNRKHFTERLGAEIAYATRHRTNAALLLFDIDFFKKVNDTHGHLAGDLVLKNVARTVCAALRTEDLFARYGGEEFVCLLRGIDLTGAARAAERLRLAVMRSPTNFEDVLIETTVSVGCATLACCSSRAADELIAVADRRLYLAKEGGRNRVVSTG